MISDVTEKIARDAAIPVAKMRKVVIDPTAIKSEISNIRIFLLKKLKRSTKHKPKEPIIIDEINKGLLSFAIFSEFTTLFLFENS